MVSHVSLAMAVYGVPHPTAVFERAAFSVLYFACPFLCLFDGPFSFDPKDLSNFVPLPEKQAVEINPALLSKYIDNILYFNDEYI